MTFSMNNNMDTKIKMSLLLCAMVALVSTSCNKDKTLNHTQVTAVNNLFFPENDTYIKLAQGNVVFEWEQARAEDNGLVMYEVVFDRETGDFSQPIYAVPSDGNGMQRRLTLSHGDINRIAASAGIAAQQTGKIKWSVVSSKGINVQPPTAIHLLSVERPLGFSDIPAELFLTGSGTEGGEDVSQAQAFKQVSDGVFEIHTRLGVGNYWFIAARNEGASTYSLDASGIIQEEIVANNTEDGVVRIRLNFNDASSTITEIVGLALWFAPDDRFWFDLPYVGNGEWLAAEQSIAFKQESWGRDERYKFRFQMREAGGDVADVWYGSVNHDNSRPTGSSAASYWYMVPVTDNRWDNCFKFDERADNNVADIRVTFNAEVPAYTHSVAFN